MKITKFGHCCLLIEENETRILTDPGIFSKSQNDVKNLDLILITHEHADHFHIDSLKKILANNKKVKIITNNAVGKLLDKEKIDYQIVENKQELSFKDVLIEGFGEKHAVIHKDWAIVQNTGYFINKKLFYPGDAFLVIKEKIEILALPVAGPWMKISEAIDYAKKIEPKKCFPVHDEMLISPGPAHMIPETLLNPLGIKFIVLEINKETEI